MITLKKAIEILEHSLVDRKICYTADYFDTAKLLIEAGKLIEAWRKALPLDNPQLLPGETQE